MNDDEALPFCPCPWQQDYHDDDCPHYLEILARRRAWRAVHECCP
jgi:hypothetical protein